MRLYRTVLFRDESRVVEKMDFRSSYTSSSFRIKVTCISEMHQTASCRKTMQNEIKMLPPVKFIRCLAKQPRESLMKYQMVHAQNQGLDNGHRVRARQRGPEMSRCSCRHRTGPCATSAYDLRQRTRRLRGLVGSSPKSAPAGPCDGATFNRRPTPCWTPASGPSLQPDRGTSMPVAGTQGCGVVAAIAGAGREETRSTGVGIAPAGLCGGSVLLGKMICISIARGSVKVWGKSWWGWWACGYGYAVTGRKFRRS
jgi:hypothetical protein